MATLATPATRCSAAGPDRDAAALDRLIAAYPDQKLRRDGRDLVWPDGTRMPADDGRGEKSFDAWLASPDLEDMLRIPYPAGTPLTPPAKESDPGRARNEAFFDKMYGDCRTGGVTKHLVTIPWLPKKQGGKLVITSVNGVAERLTAISHDLDALPPAFDKYLKPIGGTYNCRVIAGTDRRSAHGHGIAIDIAVKHTSFWGWDTAGGAKGGTLAFKNEIPREIVDIFERHGFIWGGRWYHYDTMHFEYRPELFTAGPAPEQAAPAQDQAAPQPAGAQPAPPVTPAKP